MHAFKLDGQNKASPYKHSLTSWKDSFTTLSYTSHTTTLVSHDTSGVADTPIAYPHLKNP
ncbi:hypothetical protein E2C01_008730 [Portunus trituberculatus]|uniref:Uncharacterized protein n=1 Tax=Portunus trituberculatus TaxID=210409 RepID=A0A5B7D514_PORTR|nr:hypothetical protein [Portunus trituberculatus]